MSFLKFFLFVFISLPLSAFALPTIDNLKNIDAITGDDDQEYNFEGIVKLSNCSGSLIIFEAQPQTNKAIVMTNGHCIQKPGGYLNPGETWVNYPISRSMKVYDKNKKLHNIVATKITYATMTHTDLAYYELTETYEEIKARTGVMPLTLSSLRPSIATKIEIISGYWDRGYNCSIDDFVELLREGAWIFTDSIRYSTDGCKTIGGTSGSPIIESGTRTVVAINNTSNESGLRCEINNPCEVRDNGDIFVQKGLRYGQQTYQTYACLNESFELDLSLEGCNLPK